jgi:hypothetical protein
LLLRNGHLLPGEVTRTGDEYLVRQPTAAIRIDADRVELFARTSAEAYEVLRRRSEDASIDDRVALAAWCLRNELLEQSAAEIAALRRLAPNHGELHRLDAEFEQALRRQQRIRPRAADPSTEGGSGELPPPSILARPHELGPGALPPKSRAEFVRRVQPMLIRSCATTGCHHSGGEQAFQLDRLAAVGGGHPLKIQTNLEQVWRRLDLRQPAASPLLVWASAAHGLESHPSDPLHPRQSDLLRNWIAQALEIPAEADASAENPAEAVASIGPGNGPPASPVATPPARIPASEPQPAFPVEPPSAPVEPGPAVPTDPGPQPLRDRFDPAEFNRRHGR